MGNKRNNGEENTCRIVLNSLQNRREHINEREKREHSDINGNI